MIVVSVFQREPVLSIILEGKGNSIHHKPYFFMAFPSYPCARAHVPHNFSHTLDIVSFNLLGQCILDTEMESIHASSSHAMVHEISHDCHRSDDAEELP